MMNYGLAQMDTTFVDPASELEAQGLILVERKSNLIVPRPTEKFYNELEESLKSSEFQTSDLVKAVGTIISKYEPTDMEMYSIYMLVALANDGRWVQGLDKRINPAVMLREDDTLNRIIRELESKTETVKIL